MAFSSQKVTTAAPDEDVDVGAFGQLRDPGIARRHDQPVAFGVLLDRPGQRMFAPAAAEDQDVHAPRPA
jgi:hypothetical protein